MKPIILASQSAIRAQILRQAGVIFTAQPAVCDEETAKQTLKTQGADSGALALGLSEAKALSLTMPETLIIGADQTCEWQGQTLNKATSTDEAAARLRAMRGTQHQLHSGVALSWNGQILWSTVETVTLYMRAFSDEFLDHYVQAAGVSLTRAVGGYEYEGLGGQLFERIEGDVHAILGLPLLPLLTALRDHGGVMR